MRLLITYTLTVCTLAMVLFAVHAHMVYAQTYTGKGDFAPLAPINTGGSGGDSFLGCTETEQQNKQCLPKYLRTVYNTGIALAGLFLVFSIVRGGFTLMFTDSVLNRLEGKKIILQALGGAVIVYSSYLFLNTLNPQLGRDLNLRLDFPQVEVQEIPLELLPVKSISQLEDEVQQLLKRDSGPRSEARDLRDRASSLIYEEGKIAEGEALLKQASALGDTAATSAFIRHNQGQALTALWDPNAASRLGRALPSNTKADRLTEAKRRGDLIISEGANRVLDLRRDGFNTEADALEKESRAAVDALNQQIGFLEKGCNTQGLRYKDIATPGGTSLTQVPCK